MKKTRFYLLRFFQLILIVILLSLIVLFITGNDYILKGVKETYLKGHTTANIDDHTGFDNNVIAKPDLSFPWQKHEKYNIISLPDTLRHELERFETASFVVIHKGRLLFEEYWLGYKEDSQTNSFSIAKSIVTMLLGAAIQDGYIKSLDQPITDFLPEFNDDELAKQCTVGDLSAMTAGYDWDENYYFPLNPTAKAYYGTHIEKQMLNRAFVKESGKEFEYLSGVTQLLAIVIQRASKNSLSNYLSEKFWQPLGMEHDALWGMDREKGIEKAYCCVYSNAKDFAKLGQLLLQGGNWNGKQLLDASFVQKMVTPNYNAFLDGFPAKYGYSIWTDYEHKPVFYGLLGHLGQRILVIPSHDLVIVRLGRKKDQRPLKEGILPGTDIYYFIEGVLEMTNNLEKKSVLQEGVDEN